MDKKDFEEFLERKLTERQNEIFEESKKKKSFWGNFGKRKKTVATPRNDTSNSRQTTDSSQTPSRLKNYNPLSYPLDLFFEFADSNKEKIVDISIYPVRSECEYYDIEICFILDGGVERYLNNSTRELFSLFEQIDNDIFAKVAYRTLSNCKTHKETIALITNYINEYEQLNPSRTFVKGPNSISKKF